MTITAKTAAIINIIIFAPFLLMGHFTKGSLTKTFIAGLAIGLVPIVNVIFLFWCAVATGYALAGGAVHYIKTRKRCNLYKQAAANKRLLLK